MMDYVPHKQYQDSKQLEAYSCWNPLPQWN